MIDGAIESFKLRQNAASLATDRPICLPCALISIPPGILITWALLHNTDENNTHNNVIKHSLYLVMIIDLEANI